MRIAFVNSTHRWGGVKTWMLEAAKGLQARGHEVRFFCRSGPFCSALITSGLSARPVRFGSDFNPLSIALFGSIFRAWGAQVLIANVGKDLRTAGLAARALGIPVVHRVGLPGDMRDKWNVRLVHKVLSPAYLVPCRFIKNGLLSELSHLKASEVSVLRTGKVPRSDPPESCFRPLRLIATSQLSKEKGHADLLHALSRLKDSRDFYCHILGTGPYAKELCSLARDLGLDSRLKWLGFQADVRRFLSQADIFVLPSHREGLPNSLLEAMAEGLVPVARDVGGVREIWPQGLEDCLLSAEAGPEQWAQALESLLDLAPEKISAYKRLSWQTCQKEFALERQISKLESWLLDLIQPWTA